MSERAAAARACTVRLFQPGEEAAVADLFQRGFGSWPTVETSASASDYLRWFVTEPAHMCAVLAQIDGELAGVNIRCFMPAKMGSGAGVLLERGYASSVRPEYQNAGVMSAIRGAFDTLLPRRGDVLMFVGNHPAFQRIRAREGARPIAKVQVLARELREPVAHAGGTPWTITDGTRFDERLDRFWAEASTSFDLIVERNAHFLNWRYCDARGGKYRIRMARQGEVLLGYSVLRINHGTGHIADVLALPERLDVAAALIDDGVALLHDAGAASVECWTGEHHPYRELLARSGFMKQHSIPLDGIIFTEKVRHDQLFRDRLMVHYMAGDSDVI
jgi:hypothetical protein